jgi:glycosyltransferase involved in cell wall biosynthesis
MKKFSVITINYNNREGLRQTIESVIGQSFSDYEYIIIDGGSTDGSVEVIKEYADKIDYWVSEPDNGIYNAMNKGILQAHGEYLNFMNSGDCFHDTSVLEKVNIVAKADLVLGRDYRNGCDDRGHGFGKQNISLVDLWKEPINHQSAFIRRCLFEKYMYDESYEIFADQKFFADVLIRDNCSFQNIEMIVVDYDENGLSANSLLLDTERTRIFRELLPERVLVDYELFMNRYGLDAPILNYISDLNKTYRFQHFVCALISFYMKIKNRLFILK